ncbi:MAG: dTDP-glucose 4,6-dehydratase [Myxococcales bacterium]|nr:dTDP-glucose 4,6-dehydratase [Myxococcales bacterium]
MVKTLVTGGAGFIGANFLLLSVPRHPEQHFINADRLSYAANLSSLEPLAECNNYTFEQVDLGEAEAVDVLMARHRPDRIVHFAAESHVDRSIQGPGEFVRSNIVGTFNLLEAFRRQGPEADGLFHHVSTDEVFGSLGPEGRFTEQTAYDPSSPYSASKAASDHLVRAYGRTYGLPVKITNCSNNYGPYQFPEKLIPLMILNALENKPLPIYGKGDNVRDWLYVEDHCEAIWAVIERGKVGETYNIGGNCELTNLEVVQRICQVVAEQTGASVAQLEALITFVQDRPGHDQRYAMDASKLAAECGFVPAETFESGLQKTVRWYLDNPAWIERIKSGDYRHWVEEHYGKRHAGHAGQVDHTEDGGEA